MKLTDTQTAALTTAAARGIHPDTRDQATMW